VLHEIVSTLGIRSSIANINQLSYESAQFMNGHCLRVVIAAFPNRRQFRCGEWPEDAAAINRYFAHQSLPAMIRRGMKVGFG
jgi:hypothetical protein